MEEEESELEDSEIYGSLWTAYEKELFFERLEVYGKNPSLIALDIGTKNQVEVSAYLGLLRNECLSMDTEKDFKLSKKIGEDCLSSEDETEANLDSGLLDDLTSAHKEAIEKTDSEIELELLKAASLVKMEENKAISNNDRFEASFEDTKKLELLDGSALYSISKQYITALMKGF